MYGDSVDLTWNTINANDVTITAKTSNGSKTVFSTTTALTKNSGVWPVVVEAETTYTLTAKRPNRSTTCTVAVGRSDLEGLGLGETQGASTLSLRNLPETGFYPTTGFMVIMNVVLVAATAFVAYVLLVFLQLAKRAKTVPIRDGVFTPQTVRYRVERTTFQTKLLWRIIAVTVILLLMVWYAFR